MAKYLIAVPHEGTKVACELAVQTFLNTGSHFLTNADWGCLDGEHKAWFLLEVDSKKEALSILPPAFRAQAKVVQLSKFRMQEIDEVMSYHPY